MGLLDGGLGAVFGTAFGAVFDSGVLHKMQHTDLGTGGFTATPTDYPVRLILEQLDAVDRAASGIPASAIRLTVLQLGLTVSVDLDDGITTGGASYRVIKVDRDPAMASFIVMAVPA